MKPKIKCDECDDGEAEFFHSKCCGAHFEGIITREGEYQIVCETCGEYVGTLMQ